MMDQEPMDAPQPPQSTGQGLEQSMATKPEGVFGEPGTGYVQASDGPFECGTCLHFNQGQCDHPKIVAAHGAQVGEDDCCSFWWPSGQPHDEASEKSEPSSGAMKIARGGQSAGGF